jgi:catechol 2,3-dioxygenase-like lactoylglutathione lyase family enzyme
MAGPIDPELRKVHLSLNVSDLSRSIAFYRALVGAEPAKVKADYAKFDIADPPMVLSLMPGRAAAGGSLNHAGLRVRDAAELVDIQRRCESAGISTRREEGVACCHATQTKFWAADPDGTLWEIYVFHEDLEDDADDHHIPEAPSPAADVWSHRLGDPLPPRLPFEDATLAEARLEGSINMSPETLYRGRLFGDVRRALRPGAPLYIHGLAGDRPCHARISLPGPAAAVKHVPAVTDVVAELKRAGFADIEITLLSEVAYFEVDGVPMRELRVTARAPAH